MQYARGVFKTKGSIAIGPSGLVIPINLFETLRCDWHPGSLTLGLGGSHMRQGRGRLLTYETQLHRNFDASLFDLPI